MRKMQRREAFWVTEAAASEKFTAYKVHRPTGKTRGRYHKISSECCIVATLFSLSLSLLLTLGDKTGGGSHYENASVKPDIS